MYLKNLNRWREQRERGKKKKVKPKCELTVVAIDNLHQPIQLDLLVSGIHIPVLTYMTVQHFTPSHTSRKPLQIEACNVWILRLDISENLAWTHH